MVSTGELRRRPFGAANKSLIDRRPLFHLYRRIFGAEDMHSHYRWNAIRDLIDYNAAKTLEVGGGDGRMSFEIVDHGHAGELLISEYDAASLAEAEAIKAAGGYDNVRISQDDVCELRTEHGFDQALAIDVLEHIDDDQLAIKQIAEAIRPGGRLVVSVPTPRYPKVFGREFHEHLGHVREGYYLEDIAPKLSAAGLVVEEHRYYTGRWVARACRLFYGLGIPYVFGVLWAPLVRRVLFRTDLRVERGEACSLVLVARRVV